MFSIISRKLEYYCDAVQLVVSQTTAATVVWSL